MDLIVCIAPFDPPTYVDVSGNRHRLPNASLAKRFPGCQECQQHRGDAFHEGARPGVPEKERKLDAQFYLFSTHGRLRCTRY